MTTNRWFLAGAAMLFAMTTAAQGNYIEDDIYAPKSAVQKAPKVQQTVSRPSNTIIVATEDPSTVTIRSHSDRDVDEYNRRVEPEGKQIESNSSTEALQEFSAKERINRFYKKGVTIEVDDPDNTNIYVLNSNDYNVYISNRDSYWNMPYYGWNSPYYWNSWTWGGFYSSWSVWSPFYWGGWYSPWYDPWYYRPWYGSNYWGGGWGPYYPAYHHNHYYSYSSPYRYYSNGRASRGSDGGYYGRSSSSYSERGRVSSSGGRGTRDNTYDGYSSSRSGTTRNTINQSGTNSGRRTREVMTRDDINNRTYDNRNGGAYNSERRSRSTFDNSNSSPSRSTYSAPRSSGFGSGGGSFGGGGSVGGGGGASGGGGRGRR